MLAVITEGLAGVSDLEISLLVTGMKVHYIDSDLRGELQGVADYLGIEFNRAAAIQFLYELDAACTSIIYRQTNNTLVHGRNLDFPFATQLRDMLFNVDFYRGSTYVYTATTFPGYFGVITGIKPGAFAISIDERFDDNYGESKLWNIVGLIRNFLGLLLFREGNTRVVRKALETQETWEGAVNYLSEVPIIAEAFYIISGLENNQGAVVTRNRWNLENLWLLNETTWFLLETNYDHWLPAPKDDDRRDPAIKYMNTVGQANLDVPTFFQLFDTYPMLQESMTVYTAVMSPATGFYSVIIRQNVTVLN
jgi:hypothetical protein